MSNGCRWRQYTSRVVGIFDLHPIRKERSLKRRNVSSTDMDIISTQRVSDGVYGIFVKSCDIALYIAPVEPLPFTTEGLKAFNDVANLVDPTGRCHFPGIPRVNSSPYPMEIIQLPDRVIFLYEYMHNFRVIWTDGREHRPTWPTTLMGDSIGRWEGDTLSIDTVNLSGDTWLDSHGNRHSDELHIIERWRRISANELWYEATIDDSKFYTESWSTGWVMALAPPDWEIMEHACTDNNKDMDDGHLQPGALDGSGRDGSAIATPRTYPPGASDRRR